METAIESRHMLKPAPEVLEDTVANHLQYLFR